ncbi:MAG: DUF1844 domain-containing protein [Bdellovibrionales bacterium]|nr:DUF1844 domain-containing protein [Bdellovibrionales bacterium]
MLPKIDLTTFFLSVSQAAMQSMDSASRDLEIAKHNIDLLELMHEKTHGNRSTEEDQLLNHLLFQLRMTFVSAEKESKGGASHGK